MKTSFLKKEDSLVIYAIAAIFMVYIHVYGTPDKISIKYVWDNSIYAGYNLEHYLCIIGAICVGLYAFVSGYGLCAIADKKKEKINKLYLMNFKRLLEFYKRYWLIFIIFIPYGIFSGMFDVNMWELIKGILGINVIKLNATWWYVWMYVKIILFFPIFYKIILFYERYTSKWNWAISSSILLIVIITRALLTHGQVYLELSFLGCIFCRYDLFRKWDMFFSRIYMKKFLIYIVLLLESIGFIIFWDRTLKIDIIAVPIFIFCIIEISRWFNLGVARRFLLMVGKYSIYIWLIHAFFAFYFLQPVVLWLRYSIFIWIAILLLSIILGYFIDKIYRFIRGGMYV